MSAPFFDNISGAVTAGPGTGAFTLTSATANAEPWTTIPNNQFVHYRADEGTTWERGIGVWNGTTLTRGLIASSSGALITFGTGVIVIIDIPADEVQPHIGGGKWGMYSATAGATALGVFGLPAITVQGTGGVGTLATTNYVTRQQRIAFTSLTTAGALGGALSATAVAYVSATAFMGGFEFVSRFGATVLPTGPRLAVGLSAAGFNSAVEPSTILNSVFFGMDSTDTNIQLITNNGTTTTKVNTGLPLVVGAGYEAAIWAAPGNAKIYYRICRLDTGAIFSGSTTTTLPTTDIVLTPQCTGGLGTVAGTAIVFCVASVYLRTSF